MDHCKVAALLQQEEKTWVGSLQVIITAGLEPLQA